MPDHFDLETFRRKHFDYRDGHHVAFFGPTQQAGKTTTAYQLLDVAATPERPGITLCMKHRDRTIAHWSRELGFREVPTWPPGRKLSEYPALGGATPRGYTLWPRQTLTDVAGDNRRLQREFGRAIIWNRGHCPAITHANELYGLLAELGADVKGPGGGAVPGLRPLLTAVVTRDSVAGHGLWYESQKPSGTQGISIPGFFFNSAEHMFLSKDGEERNRRRYGEIGCGINESEIERQTLGLDPFSWLYIRRTGPEWCVVDAYDERLTV
jgi:hypothetical protein